MQFLGIQPADITAATTTLYWACHYHNNIKLHYQSHHVRPVLHYTTWWKRHKDVNNE